MASVLEALSTYKDQWIVSTPKKSGYREAPKLIQLNANLMLINANY